MTSPSTKYFLVYYIFLSPLGIAFRKRKCVGVIFATKIPKTCHYKKTVLLGFSFKKLPRQQQSHFRLCLDTTIVVPLHLSLRIQTSTMVPVTKDPKAKKATWSKHGQDMQFLLQWFTTEGNFDKFQGKNNNGLTKKYIADKLADEINKLGPFNRTGKDVLNKIQYVITKFKDVHDSIGRTGSGVEDQGTLDEKIKKSCYFYFDLLPILGSRSGIVPPATNEKAIYLEGKIQSLKATPQLTSNKNMVTVTNDNYDDSDDDDDDNIGAAPEVSILSSKPKENFLERLGSTNTPHAASKQVCGVGNSSKSKVVKRTKQIESETAKLRNVAEETEKMKRKKLELDIEVAEIDKRTKLASEEEMKSDKQVKDIGKFVELVRHYNELKKTFSDEEIVSMFPLMKKCCKQSEN